MKNQDLDYFIHAIEKSLDLNKNRIVSKMSYKTKRKVVIGAIVGFFSISTILLARGIGEIGTVFKDYKAYSHVLEVNKTIVDYETDVDENGKVHYDVDSLIDYIKDGQDDIPERLFGVLYNIGFDNTIDHLDEMNQITCGVYTDEQGKEEYASFEDFLIKNGHVDKDGKASVEAYKEKMKDYINEKDYSVEQAKGNNR